MIRGHIRSLRDFGIRCNTLPRDVVIRYLSKFGSMRLNKARMRLEKEMEDFHPSDVNIMRRIISAVISHSDYMRSEVRQIIIDTLSSCMEKNNTWKGGLPSLRTRLEREELYWEYELECSEDDDFEAQGLFSVDVHHKITVPFLSELLEKLGSIIPAHKYRVLQKMVLNIGAIFYCESKEALYLAIANIVSELVDVAGVMRALLKKINFEYLYQLIAGVVKFLANPDAYEAQSSYSGNQMDVDSFGSLFRILAAGYAFIFDKQAAAMSTFSLEWQQKLFSAYRNTSCIPELYNFFVLFMRSTYEFVQVHILGNDVDHDGTLVQLDATYEDWKRELFALEALMEDAEGSIYRNPETRRKIIQNHEIGQALHDVIEVQKTITRGAYSHFQTMFAKSTKMATLARQAGSSATFRAPPYMLQICGSSGIGKSTCLERLTMYLNEFEPVPYEEGGLLFTRQTSSKYWEGYHSQLAVVYDDLFQTTDPTNRAETANEIINVCNSVPLSLNMAELSAKGNVMFNSKFVFCTTNVWEERAIGLAHIQAFWRRFGSRWKFSFPEEYMSNGKPDWAKMERQHPEMEKNELMYELMQCQLVSDRGDRTMSYMEFCEYVKEDSHRKFLQDNIALQKNREFVRSKLGEMRKDADPISVEVTDRETGQTATIEVVEEREAQSSLATNVVKYDLNREQLRENFGHEETSKLKFGKINYAVSEVIAFLRGVKSLVTKNIPNWSFQQWAGQYAGRIFSRWRGKMFPQWKQGREEHTFAERVYIWCVMNRPTETEKAFSDVLTMIFTYMASYYCTTKFIHWAIAPKFEAQSNEFKDKKTRKPRKIKGGKKAKWHRSTDYDDEYYYEGQGRAHDSHYLGKIRGNMARLECAFVFGEYIRRESQNIVFVTGNAAIGTAHLLYNFQDCDKAASYVTLRTATLHKKIWVKDIEWLTPDEKCGMDVGMIVFRDKAINRPDIVSRFLKESDIENVRINECTLSKIVPSGHNTFVCADRDMENCEFAHNSPIYNSVDDEYSITDYLKYRCFTERGDCGSVVTHNDASIEGAIIGIHVAGRPNSNDGLGQVVTRDMVIDMLETMGIKFRRKAVVETQPVNADDIASYAAYGEIDVIGKLNIKDAVRMPDKTSLRPSLVHDVFQKSTHAPAMLRKTNGISPVHVALKKANVPEGKFDTARFKECETHMNNIRKSMPTHGMDRVLTDKEAVNGIKGTNLLKPINIHTSPGYPYVLHRKCKGKQDWLKQVDTEEGPIIHMTKPFMEEFHEMEEQIYQGDIPLFPFISCLKDEKRPKEKVETGKTRLFSVGNQLHLLLSRKYFGGYVAFLTANRNVLPSKVGLVMNGVEFHDFYQYMVKNRTQAEAMNNANDGDFSGFDDSLMPELIRSFFESAREWYAFHRKDDDKHFERHDTIRRNLIETYMGPPHLMGNIMYSLCKANSSGSFATVHINGHANELAHRYVFCELGEKYGMDNVDFDEHVNLATYGDDSVLVLSDIVKDFYNGMTLAPVFKEAFGMTYTTATKGTAETPVRPLSDIDFCKRKFVYRPEMRKMVGQMEITNVLEITNWIKESPDANYSTLENVESAHRELIFHGEKVYNEYSKKFVDGCARAGLCYKPRNYRYWQNKYYHNEL